MSTNYSAVSSQVKKLAIEEGHPPHGCPKPTVTRKNASTEEMPKGLSATRGVPTTDWHKKDRLVGLPISKLANKNLAIAATHIP